MVATHSNNRRSSNMALRLFHEMRLANVMPDEVTTCSVLLACGDVGAFCTGEMVHDLIERNRIEKDLILLSTCMPSVGIIVTLRASNSMNYKDVLPWSPMIMEPGNLGLGVIIAPI